MYTSTAAQQAFRNGHAPDVHLYNKLSEISVTPDVHQYNSVTSCQRLNPARCTIVQQAFRDCARLDVHLHNSATSLQGLFQA